MSSGPKNASSSSSLAATTSTNNQQAKVWKALLLWGSYVYDIFVFLEHLDITFPQAVAWSERHQQRLNFFVVQRVYRFFDRTLYLVQIGSQRSLERTRSAETTLICGQAQGPTQNSFSKPETCRTCIDSSITNITANDFFILWGNSECSERNTLADSYDFEGRARLRNRERFESAETFGT